LQICDDVEMLRFISQGNHTCHASVQCVCFVFSVHILVVNEFTVCTDFIAVKSDVLRDVPVA